MTTLSHLNISTFRNIENLSSDAGEGINLIYGANGSGKTSILEAIHLLANGKSFRSSRVTSLIQHGFDDLMIVADLKGGVGVGLQKRRNQKPTLKLRGEKQPSWVEVARLLPVQIIDSATFRLLE